MRFALNLSNVNSPMRRTTWGVVLWLVTANMSPVLELVTPADNFTRDVIANLSTRKQTYEGTPKSRVFFAITRKPLMR